MSWAQVPLSFETLFQVVEEWHASTVCIADSLWQNTANKLGSSRRDWTTCYLRGWLVFLSNPALLQFLYLSLKVLHSEPLRKGIAASPSFLRDSTVRTPTNSEAWLPGRFKDWFSRPVIGSAHGSPPQAQEGLRRLSHRLVKGQGLKIGRPRMQIFPDTNCFPRCNSG